jgi:hypothetical protein
MNIRGLHGKDKVAGAAQFCQLLGVIHYSSHLGGRKIEQWATETWKEKVQVIMQQGKRA